MSKERIGPSEKLFTVHQVLEGKGLMSKAAARFDMLPSGKASRTMCPRSPLKDQPEEPSPTSAKTPAYRTVPAVQCSTIIRQAPSCAAFASYL